MPEPGRPGSRQAAIPASWLPPATAGGGVADRVMKARRRSRCHVCAGMIEQGQQIARIRDPASGRSRWIHLSCALGPARPGMLRYAGRDIETIRPLLGGVAGSPEPPGAWPVPCAGWPRYPSRGRAAGARGRTARLAPAPVTSLTALQGPGPGM